jgi:hypothetical protein
MNQFYVNAPWLVPFLVLIISLGYNLYSLTDKVEEIKEKQDSTGQLYIKKVDDLDYRISRIEEFCCSEIKK